MQTAKESGLNGRVCLTGSKFAQAMKERMDQDDVSIKAIDTKRQNKIEMRSVNSAIPTSKKRICGKPEEKLQEMRPGN